MITRRIYQFNRHNLYTSSIAFPSPILTRNVHMMSSTAITDYSHFLSPKSSRRKPSAIRALVKLMSEPGMISLGGGSPHPSTFPFSGFQYTLKNGKSVSLTAAEVEKALQYSETAGIPPLADWLRSLQRREHGPPKQDFEICVGTGSQDVLSKAFDALLSDGDPILIEAPAYVGTLSYLKPMQLRFAEIPVDQHGLVSADLSTTLDSWDESIRGPKPKILYTVPVAGNPTGLSTTLERKKEIYTIAQKHNLIILEDDPYYYLQFGDRTPSYFSMDVDGRVLRFDSLSKILSAGVRLGWATGPKPLIDRIVLHSMSSNLHVSGISQVMVSSLLSEWGHEGFQNHTRQVAKFYESRRDVFLRSAEKHLKGLAEWHTPTAGMFVWLNLLGVEDSARLIQEKAVEKKVLFVPGFEFFAVPRVTGYVRASYSLATDEGIDTALSRLAELLNEYHRSK